MQHTHIKQSLIYGINKIGVLQMNKIITTLLLIDTVLVYCIIGLAMIG